MFNLRTTRNTLRFEIQLVVVEKKTRGNHGCLKCRATMICRVLSQPQTRHPHCSTSKDDSTAFIGVWRKQKAHNALRLQSWYMVDVLKDKCMRLLHILSRSASTKTCFTCHHPPLLPPLRSLAKLEFPLSFLHMHARARCIRHASDESCAAKKLHGCHSKPARSISFPSSSRSWAEISM